MYNQRKFFIYFSQFGFSSKDYILKFLKILSVDFDNMVIAEVAWEGTASYFHEGVTSVNAATQ
ncbi:hypothetical protein SUT286_11640 [Streptococcus parasuis]|nr:hypothetical protein SUT286_11640 [Streptococcus parasuis]